MGRVVGFRWLLPQIFVPQRPSNRALEDVAKALEDAVKALGEVVEAREDVAETWGGALSKHRRRL